MPALFMHDICLGYATRRLLSLEKYIFLLNLSETLIRKKIWYRNVCMLLYFNICESLLSADSQQSHWQHVNRVSESRSS